MLPPSIPISQPVRSSKFGALPSPCTAHVHAKVDVLVWFEICELAPSGEYVPCVVEHSDELPCRGLFMLHQGIQRRIRITIVHDHSAELKWRDVRELVVGRIRNTPEPEDEEDNDSSVLSLGLFPGEYLELPGDDRCMFRFEAAWDSSLHNSLMLNRVTSAGEQIFMTISAYLEVTYLFLNILLDIYYNIYSWRIVDALQLSLKIWVWLSTEEMPEQAPGPLNISSAEITKMLKPIGFQECMSFFSVARLKQVVQVCSFNLRLVPCL